jgi:hypothetical protein
MPKNVVRLADEVDIASFDGTRCQNSKEAFGWVSTVSTVWRTGKACPVRSAFALQIITLIVGEIEPALRDSLKIASCGRF